MDFPVTNRINWIIISKLDNQPVLSPLNKFNGILSPPIYFIWIEYAEIKMKIFYICAVIDILLQLLWRKWQNKNKNKTASQKIVSWEKLLANIICKSQSFTQSQYLTISDRFKSTPVKRHIYAMAQDSLGGDFEYISIPFFFSKFWLKSQQYVQLKKGQVIK